MSKTYWRCECGMRLYWWNWIFHKCSKEYRDKQKEFFRNLKHEEEIIIRSILTRNTNKNGRLYE